MQTDTATIITITDNRRVVRELWGGLTLTPYGLALLFSAYAFAHGWIDWETNGGPPFLGFLAAFLLDKLLQHYYKKKYNFSFRATSTPSIPKDHSTLRNVLALLVMAGFIVAWFIDTNAHLSFRLIPLWLATIMGWRGLDWIHQNWAGYGIIHLTLGLSLIGLSFTPLIFNLPPSTLYFGSEGVFELAVLGVADIDVGIMEHLMFLSAREAGLN